MSRTVVDPPASEAPADEVLLEPEPSMSPGLRGRMVALSAPESVLAIGGSLAVAAFVLGLYYFCTATDADTWVPVLLVFALLFISVPICFWASSKPRDKKLRWILVAGLLLKLLATVPRYYMNVIIYDKQSDSGRYHQAGGNFVINLKKGEWTIAGSELTAFPRNTRVVGYITGLLYVVFGTTYYGGCLIYSWLAWLGLLFFFRTFQLAFPNAPPYRAAYLIFFLPSVVFWPSQIGKDALMVFLLGLLTLGAGRILTGKKTALGIVWCALSGIAIVNIRPHMLVIATAAMLFSLLARPEPGHGSRRGTAARIILAVLLIPVMVSGLGRVDTMMGTSAGGSSNINSSLDETVSRTEIGGSAFSPTPVRTPLDVPAAVVTVLYRPFLFEAHNAQVVISALEGAILALLTVIAARWIWQVFPLMYRNNVAAFCGGYILGFVVAFSNISNAGILSRQRVQMFPVLMILVAGAYERHRLQQLEKAALEAEREAALDFGTPPPVLGTLSLPDL